MLWTVFGFFPSFSMGQDLGPLASCSTSNQTSIFASLLEEYRSSEPDPEALLEYEFYFVRGIGFAERHFESWIRWLEHHGIVAVKISTQQNASSTEENANEIARKLREGNKKKILICHSRGCLDSLEALRRNRDLTSGSSPLAAWITLNVPFWGTFDAERASTDPILNSLYDAFRGEFGKDLMKLLSTSYARKYWAHHSHRLHQLLSSKQFPILNFRSWSNETPFQSVPKRTQWLMGLVTAIPMSIYHAIIHYFAPSDGFVQTSNSYLPCVDEIVTDGYDHWDLTLGDTLPEFFSFLEMTIL